LHNGIIYGIDIAKGIPSRAQLIPKYAVVHLKDGQVQSPQYWSVGTESLRRIHDDSPDYIAVDNIFELALDKDDLIRFLDNTAGIHQAYSGNRRFAPANLSLSLHRNMDISMKQFNPGDECRSMPRLGSYECWV
jgi:predicted RNase H-like nuclease (RuvC/YqgF family)